MNAGPTWSDAPIGRVRAEWDAVAGRWDLTGGQRRALLGASIAGRIDDVAWYCPPGSEERMRLLVALDAALSGAFGDEERTRLWLRRPNANLGGDTPLEVMAQSSEWIAWLVRVLGMAA